MFVAFPRQTRLHQPGRSFRNNDFLMRCDVVAVGVGDERKRLPVPRVEPDVFVRQKDAALVTNFNHAEKLRVKRRLAKLSASLTPHRCSRFIKANEIRGAFSCGNDLGQHGPGRAPAQADAKGLDEGGRFACRLE
jgi:hypothetical protein